jgi:hypothetical protein
VQNGKLAAVLLESANRFAIQNMKANIHNDVLVLLAMKKQEQARPVTTKQSLQAVTNTLRWQYKIKRLVMLSKIPYTLLWFHSTAICTSSNWLCTKPLNNEMKCTQSYTNQLPFYTLL